MMGSPSNKMRYRILLASFATLLSVGMFSPPTWAANDVGERKLHRLETLGLDIQDPTIIQVAEKANALRSVDVFPKGDNINVVLQLSDMPDYNFYIYPDKRRLVLDLYNTINIAPSSEFALGAGDPIQVVRNAQYSVDPSVVSRVVLELGDEVTPEIAVDGSNLVITTPMTAGAESAPAIELAVVELQPAEALEVVESARATAETVSVVALADEPVEDAYVEDAPVEVAHQEQDDTQGEMIVVPGVEVETETPEIEIVLASAVPEAEMAYEMGSVTKEAEWIEAPIEAAEVVESESATVEVEEVNHIEELIEEIAEEPVVVAEEPVMVAEEPMPVEERVEVALAIVEPEPAAVEAEEINHIEELIEEIAEEPVAVAEEPAPVEKIAEEIEEDVFDAEAEEAEEVVVVDPEQVEEEIVIETVELDDAHVEAVVEEIPEAIEAEEAPLELEPIEEIEIEVEGIEEIEVEYVEVADIDEDAKELNGMFAEMAEEMESVTADEVEDAPVEDAAAPELITEEAVKAFSEMFSEMAETIQAEMTEVELVSFDEPEGDVEVSEEVLPAETLVTLEFRDADLSAVLDILARKGNLNIIAGKGVTGKVTVRLIDVPLDVALNAILNVNGYGYLKTDSIIRILPLSEIGDVVNLTTETYKLSYAKAKDAKKTLDAFLTPNGNIEIDSRTNMLLVTDIPGNKDRLEKLITELDQRVQQVLIEVIILDSVLLDDADLGISWGLLNTADNSPHSTLGNDSLGITLPTGSDALNVVFGTLFGDLALDIFIEAMVSDTDTKVLANPKVLTLNNETATIEIITEFPYNDTTQTSSGGQLSNITFKEIGTKLEVRPQITHDDHVILWVAPEQNSISTITPIGVPIVDTRRAETTLILKNHQTIVMGGLRENRTVNALSKVPFFGDLPGLKYAFRSVQSDKRDTELLVFITVHIMESPVLLPEEKIKAEELANLPSHPNSTIEFIR